MNKTRIRIRNKEEIKKKKEEIKNTSSVHFSFRVTRPMLYEILSINPLINEISVAPAARITAPTWELLDEKKIRVKTVVLKGRKPRRDIEIIHRILDDIRMGLKYKEISEKHDVPKSMITYYKRKFLSH